MKDLKRKIELTEKEIEVAEKDSKGQFNPFFCEKEDRDAMSSLIDKAEALIEELGVSDYINDIVAWFTICIKSKTIYEHKNLCIDIF